MVAPGMKPSTPQGYTHLRQVVGRMDKSVHMKHDSSIQAIECGRQHASVRLWIQKWSYISLPTPYYLLVNDTSYKFVYNSLISNHWMQLVLEYNIYIYINEKFPRINEGLRSGNHVWNWLGCL